MEATRVATGHGPLRTVAEMICYQRRIALEFSTVDNQMWTSPTFDPLSCWEHLSANERTARFVIEFLEGMRQCFLQLPSFNN